MRTGIANVEWRKSQKALVGFECARGPDRDKANAALKAGAFAVGNW